MTRIGDPDAVLKMSDLAICATVHPSTAAASADVRAGTSYSMIAAAIPAAFSASCTRCAEADSNFGMVTRRPRAQTGKAATFSRRRRRQRAQEHDGHHDHV